MTKIGRFTEVQTNKGVFANYYLYTFTERHTGEKLAFQYAVPRFSKPHQLLNDLAFLVRTKANVQLELVENDRLLNIKDIKLTDSPDSDPQPEQSSPPN
jgi:hypothetical protein